MAKVNIDIAVNERNAKRRIDSLTKSTKAATKGFDRLTVSVKQSSGAFGSFVGNVAAIGFTKLIGSMASLIGSSVKVTGEIETLTTQFEVLTGSVGQANKAVKDLQEFAANTPFQFKDLAKAEQRLLSFGFTLEESQERLTDLGDVAAASGADISELALIFGQVRAAGKLTGERLLQFQERAIPIGPALAKSLGVAESAVRELVSQGKVDFNTFEQAFESLNETGEFAFEGMIKRSRTLEGRISTLKDNFELLQANIGSRLGPAFKALLSTVTIFIQRIQQSTAFNGFLETLSSRIPDAIQFAINAFSLVINTVLNTIKIFNLFRSGVTTAISTIIKSFGLLVDGFVKVTEALGLGDTALGRSLKSVGEFKDGVTSSLDETADGFAKAAADISATQEVVNDAIETGRKIITSAYSEELEAAEKQAQGTVEAERAKTQQLTALTEAQLAQIDAKRKARLKLVEDIKAAEMDLRLSEEANRLFEQEQEQIFTEQKLIALEDYFTREQEAQIQAKLNAADTEEEKQKILLDAQIKGQNARLSSMQKAKESEKELNEKQNRLLLQSTGNLFNALAGASKLGGEKLFKITKAFTIAETVVNSVLAVQRAAAALPFPANIPGIAAETIRGATNIAKINATSPSFEQGGIVPGNSFTGDNVSANVNSGEMILNRQQQSQLFSLANGASGNGGQQPITINTTVMVEDEAIGRATSKWVANGGQLGEVQ